MPGPWRDMSLSAWLCDDDDEDDRRTQWLALTTRIERQQYSCSSKLVYWIDLVITAFANS